DLAYPGPDEENVKTIYEELKFKTLLDKMGSPIESGPIAEIDVQIVANPEAIELADEMAIHVEMMDENYLSTEVTGVSMADGEQTVFIPIGVLQQSDRLKEWLRDESKRKYATDSKAAYASLLRYGIEVNGFEFDLLLATYIANPSSSYTDVASVAKEFNYSDVQPDEAVYGKGAKK